VSSGIVKRNQRFNQIFILLAICTVTVLLNSSCQNRSVIDTKNDVAAKSVADKTTNRDNKSDAMNAPCIDAACPKVTIHAGVLNAKVLYNPKPEYPKEAKEAGISGEVKVSLVINERGTVACAKILTGHLLL
jgi:outer membrane biosynthesis protein TonB